MLVQHEQLPVGPVSKSQIGARRRLFSLLRVLVLHELEQRLCFPILVEQNPPYRVLSSLGQLVGLDVEHFSARVVAEDHEILQRSNRALPVDGAADDGGTPVEERIDVAVFDDGVCDLRVAARVLGADAAAVEPIAGFPDVPSEVCARRHRTDLLYEVLADVGEEHLPGLRIPEKPLGIPHSVRINLAERLGLAITDEWVRRRNSVLAVRAVLAERIDSENLAERRAQVLSDIERIVAAAAIRTTDVQQAEIGVPGCRQRVERDVAAVVILERLLKAQELPRRPAVECGGRGILRGPFEQDRIVRTLRTSRLEVGGRPKRLIFS